MKNAENIVISREQLLDMQAKAEDAGRHQLRYYMPYDPYGHDRSDWTKGRLIRLDRILVNDEDLYELIRSGAPDTVDAADVQVVVRMDRIKPSHSSPYAWDCEVDNSGQGYDEVISLPDVYDSMFSAAATKHPKLKKRPFRELLSDVREWVMEYDADGVDHVRWIDSTSGEEKVRTLDLTTADQT